MTAPGRSAVIVRNGAVLALVVAACNHLALPEGLFLALGVLIILETDLGGGVLAGRERIIGTLLGLLAVVIAAGVLGGLSSALGVFLGLTLVRLFGFAAGLTSGFVVGGHMVAGSLMNHGDAWWHYVFWRMVMTILGVIIGVLVSRHIYSQRSSSAWQASCDGWLLDLARLLERLPHSPEPEEAFAALRERRNGLRRRLPQLAAERTLIHGQPDEAVLRAQQQLQHGSTVMSAARDLGLLLKEAAPAAWVPPGLVPRLLDDGRTRIEALVQGRDAPDAVADLGRCRDLLSAALPESTAAPQGDRTQLLIASRLLLLADALIRLPRSPQRPGRPEAGR
ncbi:FUSC family protein [Synechococcus sp. FACHB-909]|uniref:FUSC family protein n=1 Tax=Synechococcus sp. FACHB-909 TaxID=2692863 RepID=UPI001689A499|nr:FUSC family protein [Synechococcus sp. FACHB-909]MBD2718439.1 FUSC family protein [Synechococcus sp. FACHB-909]